MAPKLDINVEIRPKSPDVNLVKSNDINLERHNKTASVSHIVESPPGLLPRSAEARRATA